MKTTERDQLTEVAGKAADLLLKHRWKLWFWADSIGMEGLLDASELTGNPLYSGYVYGLMKGWAARQEHRHKFDYCFAGVALLRAYETFQDEALLEAAVNQAEYLAGFRRTDAGAYMRYEDAAIELPPELPPDHPDFARAESDRAKVRDGGPCLFVDTIHFDGPFYAKLYQVTGDDRWRRLALDNILPSIQLLFDEQEDLFYHFWIEQAKKPNGVLWGRGNGWAMLGILHTLSCLPDDDPSRERLLDVFQRQAKRLTRMQDASGDWRTVLNDPEAYLETSIAAFVVDGFSIAIRKGWLDNSYLPVVERSLQTVLSQVEADGKLAGVSYETFPSTDSAHYKQMPRDAVVPWGQGPLITAIRSYLRLKEDKQ